MLSEEELIDKAFEIIGNLLAVSNYASASATELMIKNYNLDPETAARIVTMAFERWVTIYYPE